MALHREFRCKRVHLIIILLKLRYRAVEEPIQSLAVGSAGSSPDMSRPADRVTGEPICS